MDQSAQKVIATAGLITVATGSINSLHKQQKLPSTRFLLGCGVSFFILSGLAEAEPDLAKALAIAVATSVLLGEGGGVLTYIDKHGETDTTKAASFTPKSPAVPPTSTDYGHGATARSVQFPTDLYTLTPQQGL